MTPTLIRGAAAIAVGVMAAACAGTTRVVTTAPRTNVTALEATDGALAGALASVRLRPTGEAHRHAAAEFVRLGVLDQAMDHLTLAIEKNSRDWAALDARARIWREWQAPRQALEDANRAVRLAPKSAVAHNTLGTVLYALNNHPGAQAEFTTAVTLDPFAAYAVNNLCYLAFVSGDLANAQTHCERALAIAPKLAAAHQNLALIYAVTDIARAQRELHAAGDSPRARYNLGILHMARGEYEQAAATFDLACAAPSRMRDACERASQAKTLAKGR